MLTWAVAWLMTKREFENAGMMLIAMVGDVWIACTVAISFSHGS